MFNFLILLQIPLKIINLFKDLIYSDGVNLYEKLHYLYDYKHETVINLKIEFLNKKIYMNCYNLKFDIKYDKYD